MACVQQLPVNVEMRDGAVWTRAQEAWKFPQVSGQLCPHVLRGSGPWTRGSVRPVLL